MAGDCRTCSRATRRAGKRLNAAYFGATSYDKQDYFEIFKEAARTLDFLDEQIIHVSANNARNQQDLVGQRSALILLSGGDTRAGWHVMQSSGLATAIRRAAAEGAVIVGVAAGAVQMGLDGYEMRSIASPFFMGTDNNLPMSSPDTRSAPNPSFPTLGIVPYVLGAHDEEHDWYDTRRALLGLPDQTIAIGLTYGSGMIVHDFWSVTAFAQRKPPVIIDGDFNSPLPLGTRISFTHDKKGRVLTKECLLEDAARGPDPDRSTAQ